MKEFYTDHYYHVSNFTTTTLKHLSKLRPNHQVIRRLCALEAKVAFAVLREGGKSAGEKCTEIEVIDTATIRNNKVVISSRLKEDGSYSIDLSTTIDIDNCVKFPEEYFNQDKESFLFYHLESLELFDIASEETFFERIYSLISLDKTSWIDFNKNDKVSFTYNIFHMDRDGVLLNEYDL